MYISNSHDRSPRLMRSITLSCHFFYVIPKTIGTRLLLPPLNRTLPTSVHQYLSIAPFNVYSNPSPRTIRAVFGYFDSREVSFLLHPFLSEGLCGWFCLYPHLVSLAFSPHFPFLCLLWPFPACPRFCVYCDSSLDLSRHSIDVHRFPGTTHCKRAYCVRPLLRARRRSVLEPAGHHYLDIFSTI